MGGPGSGRKPGSGGNVKVRAKVNRRINNAVIQTKKSSKGLVSKESAKKTTDKAMNSAKLLSKTNNPKKNSKGRYNF